MSNTYGYFNKVIRLNLTKKIVKFEEISEYVRDRFIGGSGLGAYYLYKETDHNTKPLGSDNVLVFSTGPLTGSKFFNSDRFQVTSISPLTGILGESNCGGTWGEKFKLSGYDALILEGVSDKPVYIRVTPSEVYIEDASDVWGKDTFETYDYFQSNFGKEVNAACIGPAGENQVHFASIMTDGVHARTIGRCGLGAVMGSKKVKGILAEGGCELPVYDSKFLHEIMKKLGPRFKEGLGPRIKEYGTSGGVDFCESIGNLPIKNWNKSGWADGAARLTGVVMAQEYLSDRYHCGRCVLTCGRVVKSQIDEKTSVNVGGPEYETIGLLGSNCMVDDLSSVLKANELCNRYGMDTISTGGVIGFAMEANEKGLISVNTSQVEEIKWGSEKTLLGLIEVIAKRTGIGDVLAKGVREAAAEIGGGAEDFAIHVKGLEPPAHDPRAKTSTALSFATSNRGACHLQAFTSDFDEALPIHGLGLEAPQDRFEISGKPDFVAKMQDLMCLFDSLSLCKFLLFVETSVDIIRDAYCAVTGRKIETDDFVKIGEGIFNLKRVLNNRMGINKKDDILPKRFFKNIHRENRDESLQLENMLQEYYRVRGWNDNGEPSRQKINSLDLNQIVKI